LSSSIANRWSFFSRHSLNTELDWETCGACPRDNAIAMSVQGTRERPDTLIKATTTTYDLDVKVSLEEDDDLIDLLGHFEEVHRPSASERLQRTNAPGRWSRTHTNDPET
jgi:hypothetical protein